MGRVEEGLTEGWEISENNLQWLILISIMRTWLWVDWQRWWNKREDVTTEKERTKKVVWSSECIPVSLLACFEESLRTFSTLSSKETVFGGSQSTWNTFVTMPLCLQSLKIILKRKSLCVTERFEKRWLAIKMTLLKSLSLASKFIIF